jgi:hypothetical protein
MSQPGIRTHNLVLEVYSGASQPAQSIELV